MRSKRTHVLAAGFLLLAGLMGCQTKAPTTPSDSKAIPSPGCRVERLDDAEQAVRHVTGSDAYVFKIDGDLATCKFEILYRPDEESEEELLYSATGDEALDFGEGKLGISDTHDSHHILAIVVPEYPPKPDDDIVFSFVAQRRSRDQGKVSSDVIEEECGYRNSEKAKEIFPDSLLAYAGRKGSLGGPVRDRDVKPGQESIIVDHQHHWKEQSESGGGAKIRRDIVRYRVTVTCLEGGKLPDRGDRANDEGKDKEQPEMSEGLSAEERAIAEIKKLGGKVETVRDHFDADAPARSIWLGDEVGPDWLVVDLTDTPVTDAGLERLTGLTKLRMLVLENTQVTNAGLVHLKGLTNLKSLALGNTQVTDVGLGYLKGMTKLHMLRLGHTQVTDAGLEHLKGMTNLQIFYLNNTQVADAGLVHLKGMANLRQLHLDGTQVTGPGLEHVNGMTSLRCIGLDGTQVTDASLAHLKGLTNLRTLWFRNTQVTEAGVNDLKKSLPECGIYH